MHSGRYLTVIILISLGFSALSQDNSINEFTSLRYDKSISAGFEAHSNGYGINFQYFIHRTVNKNLLFSFDILSLKHPKETKVVNPIEDAALPYVYGKINSAIPLHFGFGNQFIIADKEVPNGIRIGFSYLIGPNFTLLKPQYLWIYYYRPDLGKYRVLEKYDPENPVHANQNNIFGGSSFFHGLSEMGSTFGAFAKTAFNFEWNKEDVSFKVLETGIMIDFYPQTLPVFAFIDNGKLFVNVYAQISLGKRW
ncbi:MAG TPA: hypothetical protein P5265_09215 [Bacteroidia bacterium]|nr:hypothetical protein [Bacteroidia bacterium]HRU68655.1 hypothetical protein [Bacteroidia bacterium]